MISPNQCLGGPTTAVEAAQCREGEPTQAAGHEKVGGSRNRNTLNPTGVDASAPHFLEIIAQSFCSGLGPLCSPCCRSMVDGALPDPPLSRES